MNTFCLSKLLATTASLMPMRSILCIGQKSECWPRLLNRLVCVPFANMWKVLQKKSASSGSQSPAFVLLEAVNRRLNRLFNRDLEILLNNKLWKSASIYGEICMTDLRMGTTWELWTFPMVKESEETHLQGKPFKKYIYINSPFKRMKNRCCVFSHTQLMCLVFFFFFGDSTSVGTLPLDLLLVSLIKGHSLWRLFFKRYILWKGRKTCSRQAEKKKKISLRPPPLFQSGQRR